MKSFKWIVLSLVLTLFLSSCTKNPLIGGGVEVGNGAKPSSPADAPKVESRAYSFAMHYSDSLTLRGNGDEGFTLSNSNVVPSGEPVSTLTFEPVTPSEGEVNTIDDLRDRVVRSRHYAIADSFQLVGNLIKGAVGLYFETVSADKGHKIGHYYFVNEAKKILYFSANAFQAGNGFSLIFNAVYSLVVKAPASFPLAATAPAEPLGISTFKIMNREVRMGQPITVETQMTGLGHGVVGGRVDASITTVEMNELELAGDAVTYGFGGVITEALKDGKLLAIRMNFPQILKKGVYFLSKLQITDRGGSFVKIEAKENGRKFHPYEPMTGFDYFVTSSVSDVARAVKIPIASFWFAGPETTEPGPKPTARP